METDVRFLLIHHTSEPGNNYGPGDAPALLRGMYDYHTSSAKGWPDIAYNFLIDQFGVVYEGRSGSLTQASVPDATGGSQGFSQLACFIGNLDKQGPTPAAQNSMDQVLAYLAERYAVDISPGATTNFVSRGSNRYPSGSSVHTKTVSGHRDMSNTTCPGDAAYAMVEDNSFATRAYATLQANAVAKAKSAPQQTITPSSEPKTHSADPPLRGAAGEPSVESRPPAATTREAWKGYALSTLAAGGALALGTLASIPLLRRRFKKQGGTHKQASNKDVHTAPTSLRKQEEPKTPDQSEGSSQTGDGAKDTR
ncbi:MAG: N-acetylmuramoyl-L-alanine amidase [Marmoricola sp.]